MSESCDISVIVPCYNANRYLNICLESLKAQRVPNIEMIFIDDGSTDSTGAILDAFARAESRARVVHVRNEGVSAARNRGISMATGRYIAFMDADDVLEENALSILYQAAVKSGAQITSANHTLFDVERGCRVPVEIEPVVPQPSEIVREIIHMHRIYNNLWNKLYTRELFADGLKMDENVRIGEDALLNLQLYLHAKSVAHIPDHTYVYRVHESSAMANMGMYSQAHQPMLRSMSAILTREGVKEVYFRDFLQSCIWVDEKEKGIMACMRKFNADIRPLVMENIDPTKISERDRWVYKAVVGGYFPQAYILLRVREKLTRKKWGIRR